jgi:DNA-binding IclR family transcriptional regulator
MTPARNEPGAFEREPRPGSIAVLAKAMAILEHLAVEGELTPARIAELLEEPRSTVYRLCSSLQELGYIEAGTQRGTYRLSLKLFHLGSTVVDRFDQRASALPVMQRLHDETGETVFLCVPRGLEAVCIERIDGARVMLLELRLGGSLPLHLGAAPRCLLAFEPESAWRAYLDAAHLERRTPRTPTTRKAIVAELRATRERGYAVSDQDVTPGVVSVGAPIFDHAGRVTASLSIGGLREVVGDGGSHVTELVVEGAAEVSRSLGHRRPSVAGAGARARSGA